MTTTSSKAYFDEIAVQWDTMRSEFFSEEVRNIALARAGVGQGQLAGDIDAGSGFVTEALLRAGLQVIAVDQSPKMLKELLRRFTSAGGLDVREGTSEQLPIEDNALDHVFANMYLHHVDSPPDAIREMARTVRAGGMVVITDLDEHTFEFLRTEQHDRWLGFKREEVQRWFEETGLREVSVENVGSSCSAESTCDCGSATVGIWVAVGRKV